MSDQMIEIDSREAAKRFGVSPRTIRRWFKAGRLKGKFIEHTRAGKSGMKLMLEIDTDTEKKSKVKNHTRVHRGEPGCSIVTPLLDGLPTNDIPISKIIEAPPSPTPLLAVPTIQVSDGGAIRPLNPKLEREGNLKFAILMAYREEAAKDHIPKDQVRKAIAQKYNLGLLLPEIQKEIPKISASSLRDWEYLERDGGVKALIPQYGGAGQSKVTEHEKNIVLTLLLHQNRLKTAYAIVLGKEYLKKKKIESPSSEATLRRFVDQFKKEHYDLWVLRREGEKALNDKVLPYAERDWRLLNVGDGLVADGHRLNFQVIHPITGKPCRAALVLFWDWKSSYPLGWEIMMEENVQCVTSALRNSILALGKIPKWVYLDNGKAFKAKIFTEDLDFEDGELPGMFARLNINYHFAQPYNAQSKPIERIFGILNEQLERMIDSYTGASINDKPAWTKRNEKYARSLHDSNNIPTIHEANEYIRAWRNRYAEKPSRGRDGLRPIDIYNDGKGPGVDPAELIYLMMEHEIKTLHRNGLTWNGWNWFNEAMYGLKDKVVIRYSTSDYSQIAVFHKNEFLCWAKPIDPVHPMASESESPKDMEAVKDVLRLKKKVKNTTRKLSDLLDTKQASQIDWSRSRTPEISEAIQKIEEAKKPKVVNISPFVEGVKYSDQPAPAAQPSKIDMAADHGSPLSCPWFADRWYEQYEWYVGNDPKNFNADDIDWIRWYETTTQWQSIYDNESGQRRLSHIKFKGVNDERSVRNNKKCQAIS